MRPKADQVTTRGVEVLAAALARGASPCTVVTIACLVQLIAHNCGRGRHGSRGWRRGRQPRFCSSSCSSQRHCHSRLLLRVTQHVTVAQQMKTHLLALLALLGTSILAGGSLQLALALLQASAPPRQSMRALPRPQPATEHVALAIIDVMVASTL